LFEQLHRHRQALHAFAALGPAVLGRHARQIARADLEFGGDRMQGLVGVLVTLPHGRDDAVGVSRHGDAPV
jgi:hypothetical protein